MNFRRLLLAESEPDLCLTALDRLAAEGYHVEVASGGPAALERAASVAFDVIVLDVMLPGLDGFEVLRAIRQRGVATPVLMLTAPGQVVDIDKLVGLKMGADDYLTKPFEWTELTARLGALCRRTWATRDTVQPLYQFGDIMVDTREAQVTSRGRSVKLSAKEYHLLRYFLEHRGATLSREELLGAVWGHTTLSRRTVDVHVAWLRRKIEANPRVPQYIHTVHGLGYKFTGGPQPAVASRENAERD